MNVNFTLPPITPHMTTEINVKLSLTKTLIFLILLKLLFANFSVNAFAGEIVTQKKTTTSIQNESEWLRGMFRKINKCLPDQWYWDHNKKSSNNGILEKRGYSPYTIDGDYAKYKVTERFYELDVDEVWIPSSFYPVYTLLINSNHEEVKKKISKISGENILYYAKENAPQESGHAYLVRINKKTAFICINEDY